MKTSLFLISAVASLLPTLTMGLVGISWNVSSIPSSGLRDISFPFSIAQSPHTASGYYFAQQFNFIGQNDVGYTGLQPRPNSNGQPIIHAVFSSFINGTTTNDTNCTPGADGGPGVSCSKEFSAPYSDGYSLEVVNTNGTTWSGICVDMTTGNRVHVGSFTLPSGTQGIAQSQVGFVEYYNWNDGQQHACSTLPYTWVTFGIPKTTTAVGALSDPYEYGDCVGQAAYRTARTSAGVQVQVGF